MSCAKDLDIKPAKFFMYPCRAQKHTPRNVLRRRFGSKTRQILHVPVYGRKSIRPEMSCAKDLGLKSGGFWAYPYWENVKPDRFFMYPCRGVLHTPRNVLRQGFGSKIGQNLGLSLLGWVKSGAFLAGTCFGRRGGSGVLTPINGDRQNASQIRPIFAASN